MPYRNHGNRCTTLKATRPNIIKSTFNISSVLYYLQSTHPNIAVLWIKYLPNKKTDVDIGRFLQFRSLEDIFGVTTKLWDTQFGVRFLLRPDLFFISKMPRLSLVPTQPLTQLVTGAISPAIKWRREVDHSIQSSVEATNVWTCNSVPDVSLWHTGTTITFTFHYGADYDHLAK